MHGLNGYKDVIDTVAWGLQAFGHDVTYALNAVSHTAINIIFGAQVMSVDDLNSLGANTIIYHLEQIRGYAPDVLRPQSHVCAQRFQIWDYSKFNIETWASLGPKRPVKIVPVSFAPVLQRIGKQDPQDIDVLIYGITGTERLLAFHALSNAGYSTVFVSGLYGSARDDLIARSKIVLNVTLYQQSRIFEVVRVSYLLANSKAVVALAGPDLGIEDDLDRAVRFCHPDHLLATVEELLNDERERQKLELAGHDFIRTKDIRLPLQQALADIMA